MLNISHKSLADVYILEMEGKFRANSEHIFWNAVQEAVVERGARKLVLNFSQVAEMDSFGISELLRVQQSIHNMRGKLYLVGVNDLVLKVLRITKVIDLLQIRDSETEALAELAEGSAQPMV